MLVVYKLYSDKVTPEFKSALKADGLQYIDRTAVAFASGVYFIKIIINHVEDVKLVEKSLYIHYGNLNYDFVQFIKKD